MFSQRRYTSLRKHEILERRDLLTAAPVVSAVELGGSLWDSAFYSHLESQGLGSNGYEVPTGSAAQLEAAPWDGIDRLSITFNQDVNVDQNDLTLTGVNIPQYAFSDFFYDPQSLVATWSLTQPLSEDLLHIELNADGVDPITNRAGDRLDGEWTDSVTAGASGNGVEGGSFEFGIAVNPGDADHSGWVDYFDYVFVYYGSGLTTTDPGYNHDYDIDGSGVVDAVDYAAVYAELGGTLPGGIAGGSAGDAPSAVTQHHLQADDDTVDYAVDLYALFDDLQDSDSQLTYSIASNSGPGLFDSLSIDQSTGELLVNSSASASGRASIVVEATDTSGLSTTTTVTVDVDYQNAGPTISNFHAAPVYGPGDFWIITGSVTDPDDDPTGWLVEISGAVEVRAAVWSDSWFRYTVVALPADYGPLAAWVSDPHGATDTAVSQLGIS